MNKLLIWITGNKIEADGTPSLRYKIRLDKGIELYKENLEKFDEIVFLLSGRWSNSVDDHLKTEARVGSEYIKNQLSDARILEENISVDLMGNFAFSKPLITIENPSEVIGILPEFVKMRIEYLATKIFNFDKQIKFNIIYTKDSFSDDPAVIAKNTKALTLSQNLFQNIDNGDDAEIRNILLYKTPYYYKISDAHSKAFFDEFWPGGFEDFVGLRNYQVNKSQKI